MRAQGGRAGLLPIALVLLGLLGLGAAIVVLGIHKIDEGSVGVYYFGGKMQATFNSPGYHWSMPWVTTHESIPVRLQTTTVHHIECGTAGGVVVYFDAVEVVHRLRVDAVLDIVKHHSPNYADAWIHDRLHWEVNQLCSHHTLQEIYIDKFDTLDERIRDQMNDGIRPFTPGLEVVAVRITKPRIPEIIRVNYEKVEELKASLLVVEQHAANVLRKSETTRRKAVMEAQKQAEVSLITMARRLNATESRLRIAEMDAQMHLERQRQHTDARVYQVKKQAQSNKLRLTKPYLQMERSKKLFSNTRFFVGSQVPSAVVEEPMEPPSAATTSLHSSYTQAQGASGP